MKNFLIAIFLLLTLSTNSYSDTLELVSQPKSAFIPQSINHRNFIALRSGGFSDARYAVKKLNGKIKKVSSSVKGGEIVSRINSRGTFLVSDRNDQIYIINKNAKAEKLGFDITVYQDDNEVFEYLSFTDSNKIVFLDNQNKRFGIYDIVNKTTFFVSIAFNYDFINVLDIDSRNRLLFSYATNPEAENDSDVINQFGILDTNQNTIEFLFQKQNSANQSFVLLKESIIIINRFLEKIKVEKLDLTGEKLKVSNTNFKLLYRRLPLQLGKVRRVGQNLVINGIENQCLVANNKNNNSYFTVGNFGVYDILFNKKGIGIMNSVDGEETKQIVRLTKSVFLIQNEFCPIIEINSENEDLVRNEVTVSFRVLTPEGIPLREKGLIENEKGNKLFKTNPDGTAKLRIPRESSIIFPYQHSKYRSIIVHQGSDGDLVEDDGV